jgi:hypothetical protein
MMRLLALCRRRTPDTTDIDHQDTTALSGSDQGYTLAIVPWVDAGTGSGMITADRVVQGRQLEDLTHAF